MRPPAAANFLLAGPLLLLWAGAGAQICQKDDFTNELPIFIEKRTICNYDSAPVLAYAVKTTPDLGPDSKLCITGEHEEFFNITPDNELRLFRRIELVAETNLKLQIIRNADVAGTPSERRQAVNAIQFILAVQDCNQVSWQTVLVAVLSSVCMALVSSLAIMLILYQQRGLISSPRDADDARPAPDARGETFINPRRTSSYEFNTLSSRPELGPDQQETERL